jgi:ribonuclease Z
MSTTIRHRRMVTPKLANLRPKASGDDAATAATSPLVDSQSAIQQMIATNRVLKSHISKMAVVELRNECTLAGLSTDGLKVDLVERLLHWATDKAATQHSLNNSNGGVSSGSESDEAAPRRVGRPLKTSLASFSSVKEAGAIDDEIFSSPNTSDGSSSATSSYPTTTPKADSQSGLSSSNNNAEVKVQWLGTSSGAPTSRRNVSCIALRHLDRIFLVDCGEGTRNQLRAACLNTALISHIFITHLHGDHCFGIPGTLAAIAAARVGTPLAAEPIQVFGPPELHRLMLASFKAAGLQLSTPVIVKTWVFDPAKEMVPAAVDPAGQLFLGTQPPDQAGVVPAETARTWQSVYDSGTDQVVRPGLTWSTKLPNGWTVTAAQLQHRMPCWGYVFEEPAALIEPSSTAALVSRKRAEDGNDNDTNGSEGEEEESSDIEEEYASSGSNNHISKFNTNEGRWIRPGRKMVLLGDTCDSSAILDLARGCDVLSHEATFQKGMEEKASIATHSTSEQAGAFARMVRAKNLVLTHFSGRYEQSDKYQKVWVEAKQKGKSMKEMHVSNVVPLAEEARAAAGGAKVFLANDFYAFRVSMPNPVPEKMYLDMKKRQQQNLLRSLDYSQRRHSSGSGSGGNSGNGDRERDSYDRRENNYNSGGNGGGMRREYNQRPQYQEGGRFSGGGGGRGRQQRQRFNYAGQRRPGGGSGGRGAGDGGY